MGREGRGVAAKEREGEMGGKGGWEEKKREVSGGMKRRGEREGRGLAVKGDGLGGEMGIRDRGNVDV